jgi:hypothetical protein
MNPTQINEFYISLLSYCGHHLTGMILQIWYLTSGMDRNSWKKKISYESKSTCVRVQTIIMLCARLYSYERKWVWSQSEFNSERNSTEETRGRSARPKWNVNRNLFRKTWNRGRYTICTTRVFRLVLIFRAPSDPGQRMHAVDVYRNFSKLLPVTTVQLDTTVGDARTRFRKEKYKKIKINKRTTYGPC